MSLEPELLPLALVLPFVLANRAHVFNGWKLSPKVTMAVIAAQAGLFLARKWSPSEQIQPLGQVCLKADDPAFQDGLSPTTALKIVRAFMEHASLTHLYYNCLSLAWKGTLLENRYGSFKYSLLLGGLSVASGFAFVRLSIAFSSTDCVVGFSGVIFALKVVAASLPDEEKRGHFLGCVSAALTPWLEMLAVHLLVPDTSVVGHVAGLAAGTVFVHMASLLKALWSLASRFPSTWFTGLLLVASHLNLHRKPWSVWHFWTSRATLVCASADTVWARSEWLRLISAPLEHSDGWVHLTVVLTSLAIKGYVLEPPLRSYFKFTLLALVAAILTSLVYVVSSLALSLITGTPAHSAECVLGFSGALFALKTGCLVQKKFNVFYPPVIFELAEMLMLLETRTRAYHISGLFVGLLLCPALTTDEIKDPARGLWHWWWPSSRFPGTGIRLGGRKQFQTRSWGYGPGSSYDDYCRRSRPPDEDTRPTTRLTSHQPEGGQNRSYSSRSLSCYPTMNPQRSGPPPPPSYMSKPITPPPGGAELTEDEDEYREEESSFLTNGSP